MEFLKEYLGEELYKQVEEKLKGNDKVKLANLASGEFVSKQKYIDKENEVNTLNSELSTLKEEIKNTDVEGLKNKIKELEDNSAKEIEKIKTESAAKELMNNYKFSSKLAQESALSRLLAKNLKLEGDKLLGADDYMKTLMNDYPEAFVTEDKKEDKKDQPGIKVKTGSDHENKGGSETLSLSDAIADFYK